jgi:NAD(P)-dependent dehydrogenase (short-subunit alcohol dehydrogenase family)
VTKTALIIGASRGIGLELVTQYAAAGWSVHGTTRSIDRPGPLASIAGDVTLHQLEVRSEDDLQRLRKSLTDIPIDVLIHSAGVYRDTPRDEIMAVNAVAPIQIADALLHNVAASDLRRLALITSQLGARRGRTGSLGDYGDSKAALNDAFRQRAPGWAAQRIRAIVVHPGWVSTDMGGASAPVSVQDSASGIRSVMDSLTAEMHGRFWTWDGREHDW